MRIVGGAGGVSSVQGAVLEGVFKGALRNEIRAFRSPRVVVNTNGDLATTMTAKFSGIAGNSGGTAITVVLRMQAVSTGGALNTGSATPQTITLNPGEARPVTISQAVTDSDPAGDISAKVWLSDQAGNTITGTEKSSGVIGKIEVPPAMPTISGVFTLG